MNIQVISDVHLEFRDDTKKYKFIKPIAPILVLCGDISTCGSQPDFDRYMKFVLSLYDKFDHIICVTGNHEYYTSDTNKRANTMDIIDTRIRETFKKYPKLHFLNNNTLKLKIKQQLYFIVGSTLWTKITGSGNHLKQIQDTMNDYVNIFVDDYNTQSGSRRFRVDDMVKLHIKTESYVKRIIIKAKRENAKVIILSHHCPIISNDTNPCYVVDMAHLIKPPVVLWCYGHTHIHYDNIINGVRIVSNPLGYPHQRNVNFEPKLSISI